MPPTTEVHRVCDECFGKLPDEDVHAQGGVFFCCDKKTELVGLLLKRKKNLQLLFANSVSLNNCKISFAQNSSLSEGEVLYNVKDSGSIKISVAPGLSSRLVAEKRAAEEKRRLQREERARQEQEFLRRRNEEREREREEERKQRILEKKARKAEQRAREAEEAARQPQKPSAPELRPTSSSVVKKIEKVAVAACSTCGCADFVANPFKPGKCNHCFHAH